MWSWRNPQRDSEQVSPDFDSQEEAEAFMTSSWEDLLDSGVREVSLYDHDTCVYGPMPLDPA